MNYEDIRRVAEKVYRDWTETDQPVERAIHSAVEAGIELAVGRRAMGLTARQRELLQFIGAYYEQHKVAPSFDEMNAAMGLHSKSGIHRLINGLEERGRIVRIANRARAIEVVRAA